MSDSRRSGDNSSFTYPQVCSWIASSFSFPSFPTIPKSFRTLCLARRRFVIRLASTMSHRWCHQWWVMYHGSTQSLICMSKSNWGGSSVRGLFCSLGSASLAPSIVDWEDPSIGSSIVPPVPISASSSSNASSTKTISSKNVSATCCQVLSITKY